MTEERDMQIKGQRKELPKYISHNEVLDILAKAKKTRYRDYILLLVLTRTGMRVSDIVEFRKRDIVEGTIVIRQGKGKKDRVVPLEDELGNILGLFVDRIPPNRKVFSIGSRQIRNIVYKYRPDIHPHTLRHSFAVHCLKNGMSLRALQMILGHNNLNTTQIYLDLSGEDIKEEYKKVKW